MGGEGEGSNLAIMFGQANRDRRRWPDAHELRLDRPDPKSISFGHGIHSCVGQHFAKIEGKLCLEKLLHHAPKYEIVESELSRIRTEFVQGWETMPAILHP